MTIGAAWLALSRSQIPKNTNEVTTTIRRNTHMDDIPDHSWTLVTGSAYGTIGNHSTIHLNGQDSVKINRVEDHCNVSGTCKTLTIGSMADHVKICTTATV